MIAEQLKKSILQAAIQGKLTEQLPEDGDARDLLKEIQKKKDLLIKEGKIKREKPLPDISEDEIPFEIPDNWCWVRLGELTSLIVDGTHRTPRYVDKGVPFLSVKNISSGKFDLSNIKYITDEEHVELIKRCKPEYGDILLCRIGTLGKPIINVIDFEYSIFVSLALIKLIEQDINMYLVKYLSSPSMNEWIDKNKVGGGTHTNKINLRDLYMVPIPLPPLAEQHRIVERLDALLPEIEKLEEEESKLEALQKSFPRKMKDSILQYAIQGKLTEQMESDGDARDLIIEIQNEKELLIKEGKIKKEKPLPEISEDEIPFDIPGNWCWVRLGDVANYKKGPFGSSLTKSMFVPDGKRSIKVYEQKNAIQKDESLGEYYIEDSYYKSTMKSFTVIGGDIIISCAGTIGESYILPIDARIGIINQALMRVRVFNGIDKHYFLKAFDYGINSRETKGKGSAIKNIPPFEVLKNILIPLPPIAEQKRIIERLEQLLTLCDTLE
jgi:type I restriction enzyme S subunit